VGVDDRVEKNPQRRPFGDFVGKSRDRDRGFVVRHD
jgi:hypothetical protein